MFLLIVLKLAPYSSDDDDTTSFSSSLAITLTCLLGFAMTLDSSGEYDSIVLGEALVAIGTVNVVFELFIMVRGEWRFMQEAKQFKERDPLRVDDGALSTKVTPEPNLRSAPLSEKRNMDENAKRAWS